MAVVLRKGIVRVRAAGIGGPGYIAGELPTGIVTVNGVASSRPIEVRHRITRLVVSVRLSNPDGTYRFNGLSPTELFDVIGRDTGLIYNDYIAARISPYPY